MPDLETAILAVLITGGVALLTTVINVSSALWLKVREQAAKRRDWLTEKQVKDVEEIIPTLNDFLKSFSECIQELDAIQNLEVDSLPRRLALIEKHSFDIDKGLVTTIRADTAERFQKTYEDLHKSSGRLWEQEARRAPWFDFDAKRLSIWFDEAEGIDEALSLLGKRFHEVHIEIYQATSNLEFFFWQGSDDLNEEDVEKSQKLKTAFRDAIVKQHDLNTMTINLQKALINKFRPQKSVYRRLREKLMSRT